MDIRGLMLMVSLLSKALGFEDGRVPPCWLPQYDLIVIERLDVCS